MAGFEKREKQLEKAGGFRTHIPQKSGLKRRIDQAAWSKDIKEVQGFPAPGMVEDTDGNKHRTKLVKAVPPPRYPRVSVSPRALSLFYVASYFWPFSEF